MKRSRILGGALALAAEAEREPPAEFQLWAKGENPTDYGVHIWNERSIREVMARYKARGNPLLVDVEHLGSQIKATGEPAPTAGYATLEVRDGAPWLVFTWSDYGREQIRTGQRRFLSPEYDVDKDTGEILALYRVSLVADPGTHRARMLATAMHEERPMDLAVILAALRAALAAEDPAVAKESIANLIAELDKGNGEEGEGAPVSAEGAEDQSADVTANEGGDDEEKKEPIAARAKPATPKKPEPAKVEAVEAKVTVTAAADDAVRAIHNATRDHLLATQGDRLDPSIRRWASTQPLEVVKGLLDAAPAKTTVVERAKATRGQGQGGKPEPTPEEKREAEEMDRAMGLRVQTYRAPYRREDGTFVHPINRPSDVRAHLAAQAAKKEA